MKLKFFATIFISLLLFNCTDNEQSTIETSNKIKSINGKHYLVALNAKGKIIKGELESSFLEKFNAKEQLEEEIQYNFDGKISTRKSILYSEDQIIKIYDADNELIEKLIITKDHMDNITDTKFIRENDKTSHMYSIFEYDDKGNILVKQSGLKENASNLSKTIFEYDSIGNNVLQKKYNFFDGLENILKNDYDNNGNRTSYKIFRLPIDKAVDFTLNSKAKEEDLVISYSGYTKYDTIGNIVSSINYSHIANQEKITDKNSFKYEYDKKGNWIKKIVFEFDSPKKIIERSIEYQ